MKQPLSLAMARRIALAAQGFGEIRPSTPPGRRHIKKVLARLGLLQIDSVSAVVRAHYMPLFSRIGPYPMSLVDEGAAGRKCDMFEYWAHEASFLPVQSWPLLQWRMERAACNDEREIYKGLARWAVDNKSLIDTIFEQVREKGPIAASDIVGSKGKGGWWGWSDEKHAFEWLFWAGRITTHSRRGFERLYDLPERIIPPAILNAPIPSPQDAHRQLLRIAARALGVATSGDLRDYFRLSSTDVVERLAELVEDGELLPVKVESWKQPAFLSAQARIPRKLHARALLAPFDPLVFERSRAERLFSFRYRIEIYTPAEKRQYGYYVLPFLLGDTLVARADVKADRPTGVLRVLSSYAEAGAPPETAIEMLEELRLLQSWLGLERLEIRPAGDLGPLLASQASEASPIP